MAKIELKSIRDLLQERFFVPDYQRGYRWGQQQVKDLQKDLSEFIEATNSPMASIAFSRSSFVRR